MYDIIIIGAGPSGLTAGIYARRSNKNTLILEASYYGGQIVNTSKIENYPTYENISGYDFATKLYNQVKSLGAEFKFEKVVEIKDLKDHKEVVTDKGTYNTKTVIIATGSDNRKLGLDREKELTGKGVSYCTTCDANLYKGKEVCVIGEKTAALNDALYLSDIVSKVYLICRKDKLNAEEELIEKVNSKDNIEVILNNNIVKLNGENKLESVTLNDRTLNTSALFVSIGRVPENENFKNLIKVDEKGYIIASEDCHTNVDGIFVSGDTRTKELRQLVTATSDGAIAAMEAVKYVNNNK